MNTTRAGAPPQTGSDALPCRRDFLRWATASAALFALPSCMGALRLRVLGPEGGVERVPCPQGIPTAEEVRTFRDSIYALKGILNGFVFRADNEVGRRSPEERGRAEEWARMAQTPLDVAGEYISRCDSFLSGGGALTRREGEYIVERYKFAYGLLSDSIRGYAGMMPRADVSTDLSIMGYSLDLEDL